jgi:hypothetical protein
VCAFALGSREELEVFKRSEGVETLVHTYRVLRCNSMVLESNDYGVGESR